MCAEQKAALYFPYDYNICNFLQLKKISFGLDFSWILLQLSLV